MDKNIVKARLLSLEEHELKDTRESYLDYVATARVDASEPFDDGALSQAERARFLSEALDGPVHELVAKIEILNHLDFSPKDKVEPGAVVKFANRYFVIAVATDAFSCDGHELIGISTSAPIYEEIEGLKTGEIFKFRGNDTVIQEVM
jgi:hypothetical protein